MRISEGRGADKKKDLSEAIGPPCALVVFDDADVDKAVEWAMFGCFWTNGQICSATSRLLVQQGGAVCELNTSG